MISSTGGSEVGEEGEEGYPEGELAEVRASVRFGLGLGFGLVTIPDPYNLTRTPTLI